MMWTILRWQHPNELALCAACGMMVYWLVHTAKDQDIDIDIMHILFLSPSSIAWFCQTLVVLWEPDSDIKIVK